MRHETKIQPNGTPRTKGIRNAHVASANAHKNTTMRDRRNRRPGDARRTREWRDES
jgi:hypothetical protein